jgi:hypothetical protein
LRPFFFTYMKTKVINLFGGPNSKKSTTAYLLTGILKSKGIDTELAGEYAKDVVWGKRFEDLKYQFYITSKQAYRIEKLIGQVEYIICDSPVLLGCIYAPKDYFPNYKPFLWDIHKSHDSLNFFLKRGEGPYNPNGRTQTEEEAKALDGKIKDVFDLLDNRFEVSSIGAAEIILDIIKNL